MRRTTLWSRGACLSPSLARAPPHTRAFLDPLLQYQACEGELAKGSTCMRDTCFVLGFAALLASLVCRKYVPKIHQNGTESKTKPRALCAHTNQGTLSPSVLSHFVLRAYVPAKPCVVSSTVVALVCSVWKASRLLSAWATVFVLGGEALKHDRAPLL